MRTHGHYKYVYKYVLFFMCFVTYLYRTTYDTHKCIHTNDLQMSIFLDTFLQMSIFLDTLKMSIFLDTFKKCLFF